MRRSKYLSDAVSMLRETLDRGMVSECLTDEDAIFQMNEQLEELGQRICFRTYQRYKAAAKVFGEMTVEEQQTFDPIYRQLYRIFQRSQIEQKENLYRAMMEADGSQWIKFRWVMERKFPQYNLRKVNEKYVTEVEIEKLLEEMDLASVGVKLPNSQLPEMPVTPEPPAEVEEVVFEEQEYADIEIDVPPPTTRTPQQIKEFEEYLEKLEQHMDADKIARMREDWRHKYGIKDRTNPRW